MADTVELLLKEVKDIQGAVAEKVEAGLKPTREEIKRMGDSLTSVQNEVKELRIANGTRVMHGTDLVVRNGRYAGCDVSDVNASIATLGLLSRLRNYNPFDPANSRAKAFQDALEAQKSLKLAITPDYIAAWEENAMKAVGDVGPSARARFKSSVQSFGRDLRREYYKSKAMDSTTAGVGDELVPTLENANLWLDVNLATTVLPALTQAPMPSQPYDWPTQLGDANWYPTTENVQVTTSNLSTAKVTLTARGLKTGIPFSDELNEDAVVNLVAEIRAGLARNAAQIIDDVLLNADTTLTNGINSDGATISATSAGKAHWLLGFDGLVHLPLITNTGQAIDRNGAVTAADVYNAAMRRVGKYSAAQVQGDAFFIADVNTWIASLTIAEVETLDTYGPRATISSGELSRVYGLPLIVSNQLLMAASDGKVTDGTAGTTGRVLCTNGTQWRVGFRRGVTYEADREAGKGQTTLYVSFRIALMDRTGNAATATNTSIVYNITGVT